MRPWVNQFAHQGLTGRRSMQQWPLVSAYLVYLQSEEMCPAPPHLVHRVVLVILRGSVFCQGRRILPEKARCVITGVRVGPGCAADKGSPVVVLPQSSIEPGQLPQLHLAKVVLVLGRLDALLQDVANLHTVHTTAAQ